MHNRAGHGKSLLPACLHSHVQGLQDELRCHLRIDRPPQDSPAAQIHEGRQVRSSVRRRQVCNVRNPSAIELSRAEVAVEKVGIHRHVVVAVRCLVGALAVSISDEAVGSKQALKAGNADPDPPLAQEFMELTVSGRVAEQSAQAADACKHGLVAEHDSLGNMKFLSRSAIPAVQPFVIPAGADAKDAAPFREWHAIELAIREGLTNEGIPHLRPVVLRYAANFFSSAHS